MGKMIDGYLQSKAEMDDHTIHLLFSANRWEKAYVHSHIFSFHHKLLTVTFIPWLTQSAIANGSFQLSKEVQP